MIFAPNKRARVGGLRAARGMGGEASRAPVDTVRPPSVQAASSSAPEALAQQHGSQDVRRTSRRTTSPSAIASRAPGALDRALRILARHASGCPLCLAGSSRARGFVSLSVVAGMGHSDDFPVFPGTFPLLAEVEQNGTPRKCARARRIRPRRPARHRRSGHQRLRVAAASISMVDEGEGGIVHVRFDRVPALRR